MIICIVTRITPDHRVVQDMYNRPEPACEKLLLWAKNAAYKVDFTLKEFDDFESHVRKDIYYGTHGEDRTFVIGEYTLYYNEFLIDDKTGTIYHHIEGEE